MDRNEITPDHFQNWIDWAKQNGIGLDFNPTCFSHPKAADGFTLSHPDKAIRQFWIEHCIRCREIGAAIGQALGTALRHQRLDSRRHEGHARRPRRTARARLAGRWTKFSRSRSRSETQPRRRRTQAVRHRLRKATSSARTNFISATPSSRKKLLTLDAGHYHPTEGIADKISSVLQFLPEILLHVSRGVRWDSDHVVILNDDLLAIAQEIVRDDYLGRMHIGLDYFDASINRVAAWTIGARNMLRALLIAHCSNRRTKLRAAEDGRRLHLASGVAGGNQDRCRSAAVWDFYCESKGVPVGEAWLAEVKRYEKKSCRTADRRS